MNELLLITQASTIFALLLLIQDLWRQNKILHHEVDELGGKLISEIETHTKRINQVGDLAAELGRLKCELAKFNEGVE